jgi:alkaline phosphatase
MLKKNVLKLFLYIFTVAILATITSSCLQKEASPQKANIESKQQAREKLDVYSLEETSNVKNIILVIGDGMGFGQVTLARLSAAGEDGQLNMETFPVTGLMKNHSADALVTDSAASATAMACGIKTNNSMIGMDPYGKKYVTILEAAKEKEMSTGLIATSSITHATPACFGAHERSRDNETAIAKQLINNKINVLFGGGRAFFLPRKEGGKRRDGLNLVEEAKKGGYVYISTAKEMESINEPYVLGLFQDEEMEFDDDEPALAELTEKAIEILRKNENGFFLMVEGSQIDWASHDNDKRNMIKQMMDFDKAIGIARDFAKEHKNTLVIVTADHETGGLVVLGDEEGFKIKNKWTTREHSAMPVPVYAFGPGAVIFTGVYDNTELAKKMAELLDISDFPRIMVDGEVRAIDRDKGGIIFCTPKAQPIEMVLTR